MKKWMLMAAAAVVGLGLSGAADASQKWSKVVIATEGAYPPFNFVDAAGNLTGFDVDFAEALCAEAKVECEIVAQDWDGIIPGLLAKKYDAIIAQMSITEERKRAVDFSDYYATTPAGFVGKEGMAVNIKNADGSINESALEGLVIGAQRATTHSAFLEDNFPDAEIRLYDTQDNANLDLVAGRIDVTLADSGVLAEWLKTDDSKGYTFVSETFADPQWFGEGAGIAIRKEDGDLKELLNAALARMLENGTYEKVNKKYFPNINLHPR